MGLKEKAEKPQLSKRTLFAFIEDGCINCAVTPKGAYHIGLLNRAYELVDSEILDMLAEGDETAAREIISRVVGFEFHPAPIEPR